MASVAATTTSSRPPIGDGCSSATVVQQQQMTELKTEIQEEMPQLTEQELSWLTPQVLRIYVEAREDLDDRVEILREALEWRIDHRELLRSLVCKCCSADPLSHDARCFGTDPDGDLVFMNCFALPRDMDPTGIAEHMTCAFERALKAHSAAKQWTWVIHMHGFGLANLDPRVSVKLLHLLQVAYRGRLKRCIVLDAPRMFGSLWSSVSPFIRAKTAKAISFHTWPAFRGELFETLGPEVATRLSGEIDENKDSFRVKTKTWAPFWAAGCSPEELERERLCAWDTGLATGGSLPSSSPAPGHQGGSWGKRSIPGSHAREFSGSRESTGRKLTASSGGGSPFHSPSLATSDDMFSTSHRYEDVHKGKRALERGGTDRTDESHGSRSGWGTDQMDQETSESSFSRMQPQLPFESRLGFAKVLLEERPADMVCGPLAMACWCAPVPSNGRRMRATAVSFDSSNPSQDQGTPTRRTRGSSWESYYGQPESTSEDLSQKAPLRQTSRYAQRAARW